MIWDGNMSKDTLFASNVCNEGVIAQSMYTMGNVPDQRVRAFLQNKMEAMQHPNGRTFVNLAGKSVVMRTYNKTTAADTR